MDYVSSFSHRRVIYTFRKQGYVWLSQHLYGNNCLYSSVNNYLLYWKMCSVERRPQPVRCWESPVMLLWCTTVVCRLITLAGCTLLPDIEIMPFIFVIFLPSKSAVNVLFRVTTWSHPLRILSSLIHLMKKISRVEMQLRFSSKGEWSETLFL